MVRQRFSQALVNAGDDLMKLEFQRTDKIVSCQVVYLFVIIDVINLNFEPFLLFEMIVNCELSDPLWVQVIVDNFCLTYLRPHGALLLE